MADQHSLVRKTAIWFNLLDRSLKSEAWALVPIDVQRQVRHLTAAGPKMADCSPLNRVMTAISCAKNKIKDANLEVCDIMSNSILDITSVHSGRPCFPAAAIRELQQSIITRRVELKLRQNSRRW